MPETLTIADALSLDGPALSVAVAEHVYGATWQDDAADPECAGSVRYIMAAGFEVCVGVGGVLSCWPDDVYPHADPAAAERALRRACSKARVCTPIFELRLMGWRMLLDVNTKDGVVETIDPSLAVVLSRTALVVALGREDG